MLSLLFILLDRWFAPATRAAGLGWLKAATFAHRGLHGAGGGAVENSATAFARACAAGLGIECDVQRTRDGHAAVFHDDDLDRLTAQAGAVVDRTMAQLGTMPLAGSQDTIPSLRQVLDLVAGQVPLLIEVKSRKGLRIAPLCLAVRRQLEGYRGPVAVMSFDPGVSRWFGRYSPHVAHGLVMSESGRRTAFARLRRHWVLWRARPQFLAYDIRDLPSRFAAAQRRRGLPVLAWTVRTADDAQRAAACADALIAEGPVLAQE